MFHRSSSAPSGPGSSNDDHHIYANVGDTHGPTSVTAVSSQYGGICLLIAVVNLLSMLIASLAFSSSNALESLVFQFLLAWKRHMSCWASKKMPSIVFGVSAQV